MSDLVHEVAFAIYAAWSRDPDPYRARRRFERLNPTTREQFYAEAKAASRVCSAYYQGAQAA